MCENLDACDDVPETIRNRLLNEPFLPSLLDSDSRNLTSDDSDDCEFYSKTTMVENHTKRNKSSRNATAAILRSDVWSSDSGTDDFIDVPSPSAIIDQFSPVDEVKQPTENSTNDPSTFLHDIKTDQDSPLTAIAQNIGNLLWTKVLSGSAKKFLKLRCLTSETQNAIKICKCLFDSHIIELISLLIFACGFPWIEAPGEAEAQCVQLERAGLVQGVVSDDSDVWAFGVKNVYRHLFSKNKNVQHYESRIIQDSLGLSQSEFVEIAIISGGDYSYGLRGIGVVNAIELLSEFAVKKRAEQNECKELEATHTLENILKWIVSFDSNTETPEPVSIRRNLGSVILKNNNIDRINSIVNAEVIEAYFRPNVNESPKVFKWRSVDINGVRSLLYNKLGWDDEKFERQTLSALQRWNDFISGKTSYQRHITSYMHKLQQSPDEQRTKLTKRVETALLKLSKRTGSLSKISSIPKENPKPKAPKRKTQQTVKRSKALGCTGISKDSKLSEDSDFDSD
ncbi:XPG I-region [Dictyocaulus viviparus]|uniref:XPG I-region n=1 Tax=Dictyocaulus viviparus TaxID=29172 RepID=A0A0D8Y0S9_DICVI|nr:XPG I-region [Dictyocaulus viviparus]